VLQPTLTREFLLRRGSGRITAKFIRTRRPWSVASRPRNAKHIAALYAIEKDIRGRRADEYRLNQQKSRPLIDTFEPWLLAEAIRYVLSCWEGLTRFIGDGHIEFDNNTVGRSIRPTTLNAPFAGLDGGAGLGPPSPHHCRARTKATRDQTDCV
jgi:hypothetical protein